MAVAFLSKLREVAPELLPLVLYGRPSICRWRGGFRVKGLEGLEGLGFRGFRAWGFEGVEGLGFGGFRG